jgi:hypothetical protein
MYRGEVTVAQDQFASLKKSAKTLEVSELSDIITSYEEKMDTKPKINFEDSITSSGRNTRKRGRPKRYCEESDEEFKLFPTPNKKQEIIQSRQSVQSQMTQKQTNKSTKIVKKSLLQKDDIRFVEDNTIITKPQTATRGGHFSFSKQPTAIRGSHSSFIRAQTATRGGHTVVITKPQVASRGHPKMPARGGRGGGRVAGQTYGESFSSQESSGRRGRRGRPPRHSRDSEHDLPLATSLPVSLPEPVEVDLGNIFPNYNLNDVTSSTSNSNVSIPIAFETTIKREQDSDSEVECIMSASSPLPSGVIEDNAELTESQLQTSYNDEVSTNSSLQPIEIPANNDFTNINNNELTVRERDSTQENNVDDIIDSSIGIETESTQFEPNIIIKTERNVSPLNETIETNSHRSSLSNDIDSNLDSISANMTSNASQSDCRTELLATTTSTIISHNTETLGSFNSGTNSPIIRFIKTERISPPIVETSFQSIAFSSDGTDNNLIQSNDASNTELEITNEISVPLKTRIKIERHSPTIVRNEIDTTEEIDRNIDDSSVVTSSRNNELNVEMSSNANQLIEEDRNEIECIFSGSPPVMRSIKVERKSPTLEVNQITTENIECSSSGQQLNTNTQTDEEIQNRNDENIIDVQNIAYECFFSNEEQQQIQTFTSEAMTSVITSNEVNNPMLEVNAFTQNPNLTNEGISQVINGVNIDESGATYQQNVVNESSLIASISNNVINSPIHSDEEYMLLGSPQQSRYEFTVRSDHNLGEDSIDEEMT